MSKLLMNQLAATNMVYGRTSFDYFLSSMQRLGIHNLELYGYSPHYHFWDSPVDPTREIKDKIRKAGLKVISLMPEENTFPVNLAARERALRERTIELYTRFIDAAQELECPQMLLCPGRPYYDQPYWESYEYAREGISRLVRHAERAGVTIMYENLNFRESLLATNRFDQRRMVDDINSPYFRCCVDTVHVAVAGETMEQYFQVLGDKLAHVHLNDGHPYGHQKWGDGNLDLDEYLNAMRRHNYTGYITMEIAAGSYMLDPELHYRKNIEYLRGHFDGGEL